MSASEPRLWSIGKVEGESGVTLVRYRTLPAPGTRARWPRQFIVEWEFGSPAADGLPQVSEHSEATAFERRIVPVLEADERAYLAIVSTGNGLREWYFYCA